MNQSEFILFKSEDGAIKIETVSQDEQVFSPILEHTTAHDVYGASYE